MKIYLNGRLVPESQAKVSVFDHGLLYGDGVFEGIRAYDGRVFMLKEHVDRLYRSAKSIALSIPKTRAAMAEAVVKTCRANRMHSGYIRLVVTRGVGTLGLSPKNCKEPQVIIIAAQIALYPKELYDKGLKLITVGTVRNHPESINPGIKSLNYLNNILAKIECQNAGCMEGIMLNHQGFVSEATGDNVFIVRGRKLLTPPRHAGILEGVTRQVVMDLAAKAGYEVSESMMNRVDLYNADEVFLTGTAAEVIAAVEIDGRLIGDGKPGKATRQLQTIFRKFAGSNGEPI